MSENIKERLQAVMPDHIDVAAEPFHLKADQTWYENRDETIADIEDGGAIVGSSSCDMRELLVLSEERGWTITFKAGGVYLIEPDE